MGALLDFPSQTIILKLCFNCMSEEFYLIILRKTFVLTYQYANICVVAKRCGEINQIM